MTDQYTRNEGAGSDVSMDSLFDGEMTCQQPRQGYRFSVDSILLAHFSPIRNGDIILDLGCGCGIVGLIIMYRWQTVLQEVVGFEIQSELAELAGNNGRLNGFAEKFKVVEGDLRTIKTSFAAESFTRVVCNPPFYTTGTGRESTDRQSLIARHQVCASTEQAMAAASLVVKNRGSVSVVFPADRLIELTGSMVTAGLQPKRMQMVYSYPGEVGAARLVLIEAIKNGGPGISILPPFYIYQGKNGSYTNEMQRLYDPHWAEQQERAGMKDHVVTTM